MKMRPKKKWVLLSILAYGIGIIGLVYFYSIQPTDYFSSPIESRDLYGFKEESRIGILEKKKWSIEDRPSAKEVMASPTYIPGAKSEFILHWEGEPAQIPMVPQTENWTTGLVGDDELELAAFATWVPQPEDPTEEGETWEITLEFYDAKTLELLTPERMDELGIPADFRTFTPPLEYSVPKIRLLFRTETMEFVRFVGGAGGDSRTGAELTYNLESLDESEPNGDKQGEWAFYDMALLTWHDTPVTFHLRALTGEPQTVSLEQKRGEQVVFSDLLRVQWLDAIDGTISSKSGNLEDFEPAGDVDPAIVEALFTEPALEPEPEPEESEPDIENEETNAEPDPLQLPDLALPVDSGAIPDPFIGSGFSYSKEYIPPRAEVASAQWIEVERSPKYSWHPITLIRISSDTYMSHLGWVREDGPIEWRWESESSRDGYYLRSTFQMKDMNKPMKLVFLPKVAELTFEIGGMPGLPNPRTTEDLFDLKIPRLTLPEDSETAEDRLFQITSVATQNGWILENLWEDSFPSQMPSDRTFRDITPQELLNWYLKVTPKAHIDYDEAEHVLNFNEETLPLLQRIKNWIGEKTSLIGI